MWSPTHVNILVKRAKGLNVKGKQGTNDAFVTIALGKEKFQTSVKEKSSDPVQWNEQCELSIPSQGNTAEISLTVLHRSFLGVDEFLGQISLPLRDFDVYETPKSKWFTLKCKPGKLKTDYRGELEVKVEFTVKANPTVGGSVADLTKKNKGSISSLNKVAGSIGGSLMSLKGKEKKNIKKTAKSVRHKVEQIGEKARQSVSTLKLNNEKGGLESLPETEQWSRIDKTGIEWEQEIDNEDPGVNSEDEDDELKTQGSETSVNTTKFEQVNSFRTSLNENNGPEYVTKSIVPLQTDQKSVNAPSTPSTNQKASKKVSGSEWNTKLTARTTNTENDLPDLPTQLQTNKQKPDKKNGSLGSVSSLPSYDEAIEPVVNSKKKRPIKKKIIPVESDSELSSSPEYPSSPIASPPAYQKNRFLLSQSTISLARQEEGELEKRKNSLGLKLKSSYSFKDRDDLDYQENSFNSTTNLDRWNGPPNDTRVVLGRETSPTPDLPHDVLSRFNGKTREDLIEMVVALQNTVDLQERKVCDLEDYIDNLLIRVLEVAPVLLKKDSPLVSKHQII
eukprot:GFUD01037957.1.p1 GENE.GFUD01037957.1~~GFUD01037957.1.p1  ORF type:complete len:562 (-),score=174.41 GFUD01037957.1:111-1796(-)